MIRQLEIIDPLISKKLGNFEAFFLQRMALITDQAFLILPHVLVNFDLISLMKTLGISSPRFYPSIM